MQIKPLASLLGVLVCGLAACGGSDSSSSESSSSSSSAPVAMTCPPTSSTLYFCDDFQNGKYDNWDLTANGSDGSFAVADVPDVNGVTTKALQYTAGTLGVSSTTSNGVVALLKDSVWAAKVGNKSDYYVEMRIQPQVNSTTGNKMLYMLGRYKNPTNWNFGGLNVQNSTGSTQVESGYTIDSTISRAFQAKKPISNGSWYSVRLEMIGQKLTMYLDGDKVYMGSADSINDATSGFTSGKIGLFTYNKSFLIDDVKVGDPNVKPTQLSLSTGNTYITEAGDTPLPVTVTAKKTDGSDDTFTVTSSDPKVISVATSGATTTLTPAAAGTATIKFVSGSDSTVVKTITATISPKYVDSATTYSLSGKVLPAAGDTMVYTDDKLQLTFDSVPTLGTSGTIRIFKKSDNTLVDKIMPTGEADSIGVAGGKVRGVNYTSVQINGNVVTITPHSGKLVYGTEYYVGISDTIFPGATLAGKAFTGIGKAAAWSFTTKASGPAAGLASITVAATGTSADFHTVQSALNYYMTNTAVTNPVINVKNGTYNELLYLVGRNNLTIKGESRTGTIIQYNNYDTLNSGGGAGAVGATSGGGRGVFLSEDNDLLTLTKLTLKSTHTRSTAYSNQAETIMYMSSSGSHRLIASDADFYSEQDTLYLKGYNWFYNTKISGNVDFIWGNNNASLFENSVIEMIGDSQYPATTAGYENGTGGYILQARTNPGAKGFVFLNSTLSYNNGPAGVKVATGANAASYLARSSGQATVEDNIAFINCRMDTHIVGKGWADNVGGNPGPKPAAATAIAGWREYGSMNMAGTLLDVSARSSTASKQLSAGEVTSAGLGDRASVFLNIGWNPAVPN